MYSNRALYTWVVLIINFYLKLKELYLFKKFVLLQNDILMGLSLIVKPIWSKKTTHAK